MKSGNSSQTSKQQEELINRLEEIRRKRLQSSEDRADEKRAGTFTQKRKRNKQRNAGENRNRKPVQEQVNQKKPIEQSLEGQSYDLTSLPPQPNTRQTRRAEKQIKKKSPNIRTNEANSLLEQLSNSEKLAQTIALSEILSKPVALRKRRL